MKNFNFSSGKITFSSHLTKFEREIFELIIHKNEKLSLSKLQSRFEISEEKLLLLLERFQKKIVVFKSSDRIVSTNIISGYEAYEDTLKIIVSKKLKESLTEDSFYDFKILLRLRDESSIRFYLEVCKKTNSIFETILSLEELKVLLEVDKYERYYDFDKFVLKKIKKDIEEFTSYTVSFNKIKDGAYKNSKISHIKLIVAKKSYFNNSTLASELLDKTRLYRDRGLAILTISELLEKYSPKEVQRGLDSLSPTQWVENNLKGILTDFEKENQEFKLFFHTKEVFSNLIKLQNKIFNIIKELENQKILYDTFVINEILRKTYRLFYEDELNYENDKIKIYVKHLGKKEYQVEFYSK